MQHEDAPGWPARVAFRLSFVYFVTYLVTAPPIPVVTGPLRAALRALAVPVARAFGLELPGSGGSLGNDLGMAVAALLLAAVVTPIWCVLERTGRHDGLLGRWLRWGLRYFLLGTMVIYGLAKVLQFGPPPVSQLLQPLWTLTRMEVLWLFMGTSLGYTLFTGVCEVGGGLLLISPRTTPLGALVCLGVATNVFLMNVFYDVPVKVLSFHLLLMSAVLLLPDARRLANVLVLNRAAPPREEAPLFSGALPRRLGNVLRALVVLATLGLGVMLVVRASRPVPRSELQGVWLVEELVSPTAPLPDGQRWHRVIVDRPGVVAIQRMEGRVERYPARLEEGGKVLALTRPGDQGFRASLTVERHGADHLTLDGTFDAVELRATLRKVPPPDSALAPRR